MASKKAGDDELLKMFKEFDKDGSNTLCMAELKELLCKGGRNIPDSQVQEVFRFFDQGDDKKITYEEFRNGLIAIAQFLQEIKVLFKKFDKDSSGYLDKNELKAILKESGHKFTPDEENEIFMRADKNKDNKICLEEFMCALS